MRCGEKMRRLREKAGLSQMSLAEALDISLRSLQRYEQGERLPGAQLMCKIADFFNTTSEQMLGDEDLFIEKAAALGAHSRRQAEELVAQVGGLFAGGSLSDKDKDAVMQAIMTAYWDAKAANKKYAGKDNG